MKNVQSQLIVAREKRSYLFASTCSAVAALFMFYKLFQNDLYVKILNFPWFSLVIGLLIIGNIIHGFFAFKSFNTLNEESDIDDIKAVKRTYYKSLIINFLTPYIFLIIFFITVKEFFVALMAFLLFIMMISGCYFLDLKPTMKLKK